LLSCLTGQGIVCPPVRPRRSRSRKLGFSFPRLQVTGAHEEYMSLMADVAEQTLTCTFYRIEARYILHQPPDVKAVADRAEERISQEALPYIFALVAGRRLTALHGQHSDCCSRRRDYFGHRIPAFSRSQGDTSAPGVKIFLFPRTVTSGSTIA
jgi:hypothetical protein